MKRIVIVSVISIVLGLAGGWLLFRSSSPKSEGERKIAFYRDPMNPQITSPTPKKSSDGMDFVPVYAEQSSGGQKRIAYYKDPMHPWFTSDKPGKAPDCGMDMVPVYEGESDTKGIKIDPVTVQNIGVKVEEVTRRKLTRVIRTVGKIDYDEQKLYSINTKIMGWVEKLYINYTGKVVHKGDPLMELYSPELVTTQEEYLQALRYRKALEQSTVDEAKKGSDDLIQSARRRLLYWDIPESEIKALEERGVPRKTMTIYAPVDGIVTEKMIQQGQNVMAGMELYKIADLSTVWVLADIYQYELPWVKIGQVVDIQLSYLPGRSFKGRITYIYPYLSEETKTAKARIEVSNTSSFDLKPDMFATVKIVSGIMVSAVAVPDEAIIRSGERNIVVVALGGGYFDPRDVKLGVQAEGYVQILDGVREGEKIVVSSQFLIDSESNLKAAISQMSGHEGMDMSKPMPPSEPGKGEEKAKPKTPAHEKMDMPGMTPPRQRQDSAENSVEATPAADDKRIDPVCGMVADPSGRYHVTYKGNAYYFCSEADMDTFKNEPEKYTTHNDGQ